MKYFSILKLTGAIAASALAAGCQTVNQMTVIKSSPDKALVTVAGYGECETPCSIEHDDVREIIVAKAGFTPQRFRVAPGAGEVNVTLELAAPTESVEEETLPEL